MARKKKFDVEIKDGASSQEGLTILDVFINDDKVGQVEEEEQVFLARFNQERPMKWPSLDEAVEYIISQYNLHGVKK